MLVMLGAFVIGDYGDLFSPHAVYVPLIEVDVEAHYVSMRARKKAVTTANPDYPSGKRRRDELYSTFVSGLSPLTPGELEQVREVGLQNSPAYTPALWQVDPLDSEEGCAARASAIASSRPLMPSEEYVVHRSFTKHLFGDQVPNYFFPIRTLASVAPRHDDLTMQKLLPREVLFQAANSVDQWLKSMLRVRKLEVFKENFLARDLISK